MPRSIFPANGRWSILSGLWRYPPHDQVMERICIERRLGGPPRKSRHVTSAKGLMPEGQKLDRQLHGSVLARLHEISSFIAESKEMQRVQSLAIKKHGKQTFYTGRMQSKSLFKGKQPGLPRVTCISCMKTAFAQMNNSLDKHPNSQIVGCCIFVISGEDWFKNPSTQADNCRRAEGTRRQSKPKF